MYPYDRGRLLSKDSSLWPRIKFSEINSILIKYIDEYRTNNDKRVQTTTLKDYVLGLQCAFCV